mmetsp:Transcript_26589/g.52406  ORF Transcript_26589/g.52406 Transcript_26589/m.52406 type:complete len:199 (+) Transcript_26589:27-623(+)
MYKPKNRGKCSKTSIDSQGRRKVHSSFEDGTEVVEEYDIKTGECMIRKYREKTTLKGQSEWIYLIGEPPRNFNPDSDFIAESTNNPVLFRTDHMEHFCWRIRNLPYPKDVYNVGIDKDTQQLVVRTSNKKYYKKISVPELTERKVPLEESNVLWKHENNTLVILYKKSKEIMQYEHAERQRILQARGKDEGDVGCAQQ